MGDHPRSRGEYGRGAVRRATCGGSSPLSRGIRLEVLRRNRAAGIIPALAGNTPGSDFDQSIAGDHPRSRGEYPPLTAREATRMGSSPLSRGIPSGRFPRGRG